MGIWEGRQRAKRPSTSSSVSLCITHRDRAAGLDKAIESARIGADQSVELIVVDVGSRDPDAQDRVARLSTDGARVIVAPPGTQQPAARNLAAREARHDILVFLDDDNIFMDKGLRRLAAALASSPFDVVVSNLRLHDHPFTDEKPQADLVFIGPAGPAGLIFNGFGDANFAIRREAFVQVGGFEETDTAAFDWLFFAKAIAQGLRLGVLQHPAVAYARDLSGRDFKWRTRDLEGPRRQLLESHELPERWTVIFALAQALTLSVVD
jgi:glycosyltransferase involved in cell wall biosynthesis